MTGWHGRPRVGPWITVHALTLDPVLEVSCTDSEGPTAAEAHIETGKVGGVAGTLATAMEGAAKRYGSWMGMYWGHPSAGEAWERLCGLWGGCGA